MIRRIHKKTIQTLVFVAMLTLPLHTLAADATSVLTKVKGWVDILLPLSFSVVFLAFVYGVIRFLMSGSDTNKKEEAKNRLLWGVVAMFVVVTIWGIVAFLQGTFGIANPTGNTVNPPSVNTGLTP